MQNTSSSAKKRIFAIGDVHGCARELGELLAELELRADDTVVFLGDYIDRGPDSRGVIDHVIRTRSICNVVALKGNHEAMFLDFLDRPESLGSGMFVLNGGATTLANYQGADGSIDMPREHVEFFRSLELWHETDDYFFVHAGVPNQPLSTVNAKDHEMLMLWARQPFLSSTFQWEKLVIHGHTPTREAEMHPNRINLDTGCVFDGKLTAIELPVKRLYQVDRHVEDKRAQYMEDPGRVSTRFSGRLSVMAAKEGMELHPFETLNFNQFGLLMKDTQREFTEHFEIGDEIHGTIGSSPAVKFEGVVVRTDQKGFLLLYGVKIVKLDSADGFSGR